MLPRTLELLEEMAMTERKFYKRVVQVTVISDEPFASGENRYIVRCLLNDGPDVGSFETVSEAVLDGKQAVEELLNVGSDSTFFELDEEGNDVD